VKKNLPLQFVYS